MSQIMVPIMIIVMIAVSYTHLHYPQQRVCKTAPIFFWKWMCYDRMKQGVVGMGGNMKDRWSVPVTAVANEFIDTYMAAANGEYVKVYLYVLRHQGADITIELIADALNHTESDVRRALYYWKKAGVLAASEPVSYTHLDVYKRQG